MSKYKVKKGVDARAGKSNEGHSFGCMSVMIFFSMLYEIDKPPDGSIFRQGQCEYFISNLNFKLYIIDSFIFLFVFVHLTIKFDI